MFYIQLGDIVVEMTTVREVMALSSELGFRPHTEASGVELLEKKIEETAAAKDPKALKGVDCDKFIIHTIISGGPIKGNTLAKLLGRPNKAFAVQFLNPLEKRLQSLLKGRVSKDALFIRDRVREDKKYLMTYKAGARLQEALSAL